MWAPLINHCLAHSLIDESITLREVVNTDGNWNREYMRCFLNEDILSYIGGILTPNTLVGTNGVISSWVSNGKFSIKAAYGVLIKKLIKSVRGEKEACLVFECSTMCSSFYLVIV